MTYLTFKDVPEHVAERLNQPMKAGGRRPSSLAAREGFPTGGPGAGDPGREPPLDEFAGVSSGGLRPPGADVPAAPSKAEMRRRVTMLRRFHRTLAHTYRPRDHDIDEWKRAGRD